MPLPPLVERALDVAVGRLDPPIHPGRTSYEIAAADAPSPDMRRLLDGQRAALDAWLRPAGPVVAAEQAGLLLDVMAMRDADPDAGRRWAAIFVQDLMDLPAFALVKACQDFRRGIVGDGKWVPEPGVIAIEARKATTDLLRERREIDAVLTATIKTTAPDPSRKAALLASARRLGAQMSMNDACEAARRAGRTVSPDDIPDAALSPDARRAKHVARLEELRAMPPPKIGPALRKSLRLPDESPAGRFDQGSAA